MVFMVVKFSFRLASCCREEVASPVPVTSSQKEANLRFRANKYVLNVSTCRETLTLPLVEVLKQQTLKPSPLPSLPLAHLFARFSHTRASPEHLCLILPSDHPLPTFLLFL